MKSRILTASGDGTVRIWDAKNGRESARFDVDTKGVWQAIWNKDESRILTASQDGTARVWDAENGTKLVTLSGHTGPDIERSLE